MPLPHGLGKGLASLIPEETLQSVQQAYIPTLPINKIIPNQYQPRLEMDPDKLIELADSIREHGIIEPLIVTQNSRDEYELIAGERRWRAAKLAGLKTVPVVIKEASPQKMLELAIVENVQRQDLNPLEEALAFQHLAEKFKIPHVEIAKKVGYSRPAVANKIRLLNLPDEIKEGLVKELLSEGHARALLGLKSQKTMEVAYRIVVRDGLSVRATEKLVQKLSENVSVNMSEKTEVVDIEIQSLLAGFRERLKQQMKVKVDISYGKSGGKIVIPFKDEKELETIMKSIK